MRVQDPTKSQKGLSSSCFGGREHGRRNAGRMHSTGSGPGKHAANGKRNCRSNEGMLMGMKTRWTLKGGSPRGRQSSLPRSGPPTARLWRRDGHQIAAARRHIDFCPQDTISFSNMSSDSRACAETGCSQLDRDHIEDDAVSIVAVAEL